MRKYLVYSLIGAPLFLFFINSMRTRNDYASFIYIGTALFIAYVIANIGSIVCKEVPITRVAIDIVFLYVISFFAIVAARGVRYPYNLPPIAIVILIGLIVKERVVEWLNKTQGEEHRDENNNTKDDIFH